MSYFIYKFESVCPCCCENLPIKFGISKTTNLRVLKHRIVLNSMNPFVKRNPKLFHVVKYTRKMSYMDCFTVLQSLV